jgi:chromosome partitioning protein
MFISVTSAKGGAAKTVTSIHLAACLQESFGSTVLIDADPMRSALDWARESEGRGLSFPVLDQTAALRQSNRFDHQVLDTEGRPSADEFADLARNSDLVIIPVFPDRQNLNALIPLVPQLKKLAASRYRLLLTNVPPEPQRDAAEARAEIEASGLPIFRTQIRSFKVYKQASQAGTTVNMIRSNNRWTSAWHDCENLAAEVVTIIKAQEKEMVHG